ncbi:MAG: hypothetical protein H3C45_03570 [Bacteroidia bacterium]|nr:hypothetical protein [Bacteroidia bacterium]
MNEIDNINNNGFDVPPNYFTESRNNILNRISKSGFEVPDNYFVNSQKTILQKTQKQSKSFKINACWYSVAAVFVAVILVLEIYNNTNSNKDFTALSNDEIENYLSQTTISDIPATEFVSTVGYETTPIDIELEEDLDVNLLMNEL